MIRNTILFILFVLLISSCKKETCFNCQSYDAKTFDGNLDNSYNTFNICEHDGMWDDIIWWDNDIDEGGGIAFVDLDLYTIGFRDIEDPDIDDDGIINEDDYDIDGDGIMNYEDFTPHGMGNNVVLELLICSEN